jgi:hypothetical protein
MLRSISEDGSNENEKLLRVPESLKSTIVGSGDIPE